MKLNPHSWIAGVGLRETSLAAAAALTLVLGACGGGSDSSVEIPTIVEANLDVQAAAIGGATSAATYYKDSANTELTLYSMANRLAITTIGTTKGLKVKPMSKYIEQMIAYAVTELGVQFSSTRWEDYR